MSSNSLTPILDIWTDSKGKGSVQLNGVDISNCVGKIEIEASAGELTEATLTFRPLIVNAKGLTNGGNGYVLYLKPSGGGQVVIDGKTEQSVMSVNLVLNAGRSPQLFIETVGSEPIELS